MLDSIGLEFLTTRLGLLRSSACIEGIDDEDVLRVREELLRVQFQRQLPWDHRQLGNVFRCF